MEVPSIPNWGQCICCPIVGSICKSNRQNSTILDTNLSILKWLLQLLQWFELSHLSTFFIFLIKNRIFFGGQSTCSTSLIIGAKRSKVDLRRPRETINMSLRENLLTTCSTVAWKCAKPSTNAAQITASPSTASTANDCSVSNIFGNSIKKQNHSYSHWPTMPKNFEFFSFFFLRWIWFLFK